MKMNDDIFQILKAMFIVSPVLTKTEMVILDDMVRLVDLLDQSAVS